MTSALDVAAYILQRAGRPMTAMKLQKLTYYCQAWHATWTGKPLFSQQFQAWANGPVCYDLYEQHRGRYSLAAGDLEVGDPTVLAEGERFSVDAVIDAYGQMTAAQLSLLTHMEKPWIAARDGLPSGRRSDREIPVAAMREYYREVDAAPDAQLVTDVERPAWA